MTNHRRGSRWRGRLQSPARSHSSPWRSLVAAGAMSASAASSDSRHELGERARRIVGRDLDASGAAARPASWRHSTAPAAPSRAPTPPRRFVVRRTESGNTSGQDSSRSQECSSGSTRKRAPIWAHRRSTPPCESQAMAKRSALSRSRNNATRPETSSSRSARNRSRNPDPRRTDPRSAVVDR